MSEVNRKKSFERKSVITNLLWKFAERGGAQGVSFIVTIVLARMLEPSEYGLIAMVSVIIALLNVFVDSGMANALVQKKDADDLDFSSVFYFNIIFCSVLYILLFISSPVIADFYHKSELSSVTRVLGLTMLISGVKNVQMSVISKNMQFRRFFFSTMSGTIIAAVVGITMAYKGYGIWALVAQNITNTLIGTIVLWITVKWRPKLIFSFDRLKILLSFGWKILISNLLETVYNNMQQLIIGVIYSSADVAFFNKGKSFPLLIIDNLNSSLNSVIFPTMSAAQDNKETLRNMTRRSIKVSMYVVIPMMFGMFVVAKPFISVLLTDKWLASVPYMRIFCIALMFYPLHSANLNAILAVGRSDLYLRLDILKKIIGIVLLLGSMWFGAMAMAYSLLIFNIASAIINAWPNRAILNYGIKEQFLDILPVILLSFVMAIVVYMIGLINMPNYLLLCIQSLAGIVVYFIGSMALKLDSFDYVFSISKFMVDKVLHRA